VPRAQANRPRFWLHQPPCHTLFIGNAAGRPFARGVPAMRSDYDGVLANAAAEAFAGIR
jgi:hypothetical protein